MRGKCGNIIRSYLHDRFQAVSVGSVVGDKLSVKHGVPQGSVLGPLLFIIYINDIDRLPLHGKSRMYADDTTLVYVYPNNETISRMMKEDIVMLEEYFARNQLTVNIDKTQII